MSYVNGPTQEISSCVIDISCCGVKITLYVILYLLLYFALRVHPDSASLCTRDCLKMPEPARAWSVN